MALFGTKEERKTKKLLKNYKNLYDKLFYIEKVQKSVVEELHSATDSQLRSHIADIEIACISIDAAMRELSKSDSTVYQKFFNQIPKFSSFDQGADFISGEAKMYILPENNNGEASVENAKQWRNSISLHQEALAKKIRFAEFLLNFSLNSNIIQEQDYTELRTKIEASDAPKKLKALMLIDIKRIEYYQDNFNKFFYKTYEMMYNNFVFPELPTDYSDETIKVHSMIQFFIDKNIINKENPYKVAVYELPKIIKPYASELGLFTVEAQK